MSKAVEWKRRWAEARAAGPQALQDLSAERRFAIAQGEVREIEEARMVRARLRRCTRCGHSIPSAKRRVCTVCELKAWRERCARMAS
jgi:RNA polymerase-binding transcription factor DksA